MPAQWTADLIGEMHIRGVTSKQLAREIGWNPKYLSAVLNGRREPKMAECQLKNALSKIARKETE